MLQLLLPAAALLLALLPTPGGSRPRPQGDRRLPTPFQVRRGPETAPGDAAALELTLDPAAVLATLSAAGSGGWPLVLEDWPLPGEAAVELELSPLEVLRPGARARVQRADGSVEALAPSVRLFTGHVPGRSSRAFLALSPQQVNGYLELEGRTFVLSSGGDRSHGRAWITSFLPGAGERADWCATPSGAPLATDHARAPGAGARLGLAAPVLRHAPVFLELDDQYRALFASDQAAIDYCVTLVGASSAIYRRDLGIALEIPDGYIRLWNTTPPWGVITTFDDVYDVAGWWSSGANPDRGLERASVQVLTHPVFGGVAVSVGGACSQGSGYDVSSVYGSFPVPVQHTSPGNWDLLVVSHEFGHTFGAMHTHESGVHCDDHTGPDLGTIMGYCHLNYGVVGVGMRFHTVSQDQIRLVIGGKGCIEDQPLLLGDYDADGDLDALDAAELSAYLQQGFTSMGCEEVFDLDASGLADAWDLAVLDALVAGAPPATALSRLGSGVNPESFFVLDTPVLGATWRSLAITPTPSLPTMLFGYDLPHPGLPTPYGELLVRPGSLGGTRLFGVPLASSAYLAEYALPLPRNPALAGLQVSTQVLLLTPGTPRLTNAIDLELGFY